MSDAAPKTEKKVPAAPKAKRDVFRFNGEKPMAINLDHVTNMSLDGKKITFEFYQTAKFVEMENEGAALSVFEVMVRVWGGEQDTLKAVIEWTVNKTLKWIAAGLVVAASIGGAMGLLLNRFLGE